MSGTYVFISYSRQDRAFVERLNDSLHKAGIQTWTDLENISAGLNWDEEITRALTGASALLYVASKNSAQSRWMDAEYKAVLSKSVRVIPLVIDDEGPENLPEPLRKIQWVDFRGEFQPALKGLLRGLQYLAASSAVPTTEPKSKGYVFVSYADEDSDFVGDLKLFLRKRGYGYWDFRESARDYQADYTLELENVIKNAAGTLSIISPHWKQSPTARQELHFSREVQTPVFLLKVRDPGPTLAISGMTYIDFMSNQNNGFAQLESEMRRKGL